MIIITFGTFDLFHVGHLKIIQRIKEKYEESKVVVGVSTDKLNLEKKGKIPVVHESQRLEIIRNIKGVDEVFYEESLEKKLEYCQKYNASVLVMGDDHIGRFDYLEAWDIDVIYFSRTENISTSIILESIQN